MKKRVLSAWLVLCMLLTLLPTASWAAEREETPLGEEAVAAPVRDEAPAAPAKGLAPAELAEVHSHDGFTAWSTTDAMPTDAGSYYLDNNVTPNRGYWGAPGDTNLCLNGKRLETKINVFNGYKLTVSDCQGTGQITNDGQAICLYDGSELVLESGRIVSTANPENYPPSQAIYNAGFVTLKGGTVTGPYGVGMYYSEGDYTDPSRSPITLGGAPALNGTVADISITYDAANTYPLIDATAYTGDGVTIAIQANDDVALEGAPLVKLGSTPASKFTLDDAEGYSLEEKEVDGVNCLVVKNPPPVIRLSWEEDSQPKTVNLAQKDLSSIPSYLNQMPNAGQGTMTLLTDLVTDLYAYNNLALTLTSDEEGPHTLTRPRVNRQGNPLTYGTTLLEIPEGSSVTVTNLTLDGTYPGTDDSHTPPPAAVELDGSLTLGKDAKLVSCGQPPAAEVAVTPNDVGGVYLGESSAALRMESGSAIQNGQGTTVGAVIMYDGTLTMTGGSITGNRGVGSWAEAGGVCLRGGTLTLSGDVVIKDNLVAADADDPGTPANVALFPYSDPIQVVDALTGGANSIGITALYAPSVGSPVKVAKGAAATEGGQTYRLTEADLAAFFADQSGYFLTLNEEENAIYLDAAAITTQPTVDAPTVAVNYAPQGIGYQWYTTKEVAKTVVGHATGDSDTTVEAASQPGEYNEHNQQWSAYRGEYFEIALKGGDKLTVTFPNNDMPTSGGLYLTEVDGRGNSWSHPLGNASSNNFTVTDTAITCAIPAGVDGIFTLSISGLSNGATPPDILATRTRLGPDQAVDGQNTATLNTTAGGTYLCQVTWPGGFQLNSDVVTIPHAHDMSVDCGSGDPITFAKALTCNQDGVLCVDGTALEISYRSAVLPAGNYYLAQDVTLTHRMNIQGVVNLCLNGHEINFTENNQVESIFNVKEGGTLNLCDCNGSQGSHSFTSPVTNETVTVQGGLVTGGWIGISVSHYGTAAYVWDGGAMNLYGGAIAGNGSANNSVGAIYVAEGGTFQMYGGTICHNTSLRGGGVCITGTASILGGEIAHNNATGDSRSRGGGLFLGNTGSLTLGGSAVIRDNTAQAEVGGIAMYASEGQVPTLTFTGAPTVTGNTVGGKPSNVYLYDGVVADATGMTGGSIGVTTQTAPTAESPVTITTANSADLSGYFASDKEDQAIENGENNVVQLAVKSTHVHAMSAGCETEGEGQVTFTPWSDATKLPTTAGHYYLTTDVTVSDMDAVTFRCDYWIVPDGVVDLCLNGHTITRASDGTLSSDPTIYFTHTKNSTLNLCDCSEDKTGAILPGEGSKSTTIKNGHGTLRLYGGTVRGELFGVSVTDGSVFEMHGGTVTGTHTYTEAGGTFGAGVYVGPSDTFRMTGGTVTGNDRGMQVMNGGTFLVEGNAVVTGNETANVWLEDKASDPTVVYLTGALGETAKLSLSAEDWSLVEERSSLAAVRGQDYSITEADFAKLSSYDPDYPLRLADGVVSFVIGPRHTHAVSVGCERDRGEQVTFTRLSAKDGALYIGTQKLEPNLDGQYPLPGGNYYLTEDIELGYPIVVPGNRFGGSVSLCLNGHQLKYAGDGQHSVIYTKWDLNICDCNGSDGHHTVTDPTANESVDIAGGLIAGGTNGGVFVESISESAFNLYGGSIAGNKGPRGSGVNLGNCVSMHLYGGQVSYNTWEQDPDGRISGFGGIYLYAASGHTSELQLSGDSKVAHNVGGGIRANGSVTLSGSAAVADNQGIGNWPSGICLDKNSTLTMSGSASVTGNHITTDFYLSAPTCGGVYAPGGGVTLSGGAKIWNNKIDQPGGMTAAADLVLGSEFDTQGGDALVTIGAPLTADAKIGVSLLTPGQRVFTTGGGGDYADRFTSQQRGRFVEAREGELSLTPYAILQQPTQVNQCTVTVNGAPTSYKWYPAKLAEVTGANATAYTTQQGESSSCDGQGVWTGVKDLYDRYFFTIQLSRGDMLVVKPSQDLGYMPSVQIVSQDQDHVATGSNTPGQDGAYRLTVPRDGTYDLSLSSQVEDLTLTATWLVLGAEVEGQTTKQFTGEPGSYLCKIRYADGTTLTSDIATCSGSSATPTPSANPSAEPSAKPSAEPSAKPSAEPSAKPSAEPSAKPTSTPTPGKTDQAAPAGLFTVTDIPVGGTSGSIAVTKDADKLEWRPVTTPATGVWTPVAQSGDTATLTGLAAGSYEFRYKETATHNASPATQVQVRALSPDAKILTIAGDIEHGTVTKRRDMVNPGDTVTLAVQPDEGYELETITVRYTEGGVEKTITPTVKADNPAQYTFTMPDAAVSVTATFVPIPDQGNAKGEVDIKPDTPAVSVDKETLKDLAGEVPEGQSVTVKLTVEKQEVPAGKAELEGIIQGSKDDVLYLDLSLFKQVNDQEPQAITDTGSKVLEIKVPYDFTGKRNVTVYRKHGDSAAEKLTKLTARPTQGFADGTFFADSKNGAVYIYASKFSIYAIGYAPETSTSTSSRRPSRSPTETQEVWPFTDVTADDWFYDSVKYVYGQGAMEGTSSAAFSPALDTSRASIATILWRLAGSPAAKGALPYPDCKADAWYAQAVIWATGAGVVKGYGSGDFGPDDAITREQLVLMLWRYAGSPETGGELNAFADQSAVSGWVYPAMEWAVERGVITGKPGGILDPQGQVTRAETAAMLERYLQAEQ